MKITHIIPKEKFTAGYIDFMKLGFSEYSHSFIVVGKNINLDICDNAGVFCVESPFEIFGYNNSKLLRQADKIIVSGVFNIRYALVFMTKRLWKKTYLQFWGTDIYSFRDASSFTNKIKRFVQRYCVKNCYAVINLIDGDYEQLKQIFNIEKEHFVAPMAESRRQAINYKLFTKEFDDNVVRILLGNSATNTNNHLEVIERFSLFDKNKFTIYCPLSYGEEQYKKEVIEFGKNLLGDSFVPLVDFIDKDQYCKILANCDAGIFNNDRQQGMGNIIMLLAMGKKVYLRSTTSMWNTFKAKTEYVYSMDELYSSKLEDIAAIEKEAKKYNSIEFGFEKNYESAINQWERIFC